jgi:hypothetical protein
MEYAKKFDPLRHVPTYSQTQNFTAKEMSYLMKMGIPALHTSITLFGVAFMTQRNSNHSRCVVPVVPLLVIESLAVELLYAPMIQPA